MVSKFKIKIMKLEDLISKKTFSYKSNKVMTV